MGVWLLLLPSVRANATVTPVQSHRLRLDQIERHAGRATYSGLERTKKGWSLRRLLLQSLSTAVCSGGTGVVTGFVPVLNRRLSSLVPVLSLRTPVIP